VFLTIDQLLELIVEVRTNTIIMTSLFADNPQLLFTIDQSPRRSDGFPRSVKGVAILDKYLCVVYDEYDKVQVFDCEDRFKKTKEIQVNGISYPLGMVGCSVTSQLFIISADGNIWRVNVNTGHSDVFIKLDYTFESFSLAENHLLVMSPDSLLMYDIHSGQRMKKIPYTGDLKYTVSHAIESNKDSFFVCHSQSGGPSYQSDDDVIPRTVSEIDSEGRVIRVFDNA
jgi:hypothetical protein